MKMICFLMLSLLVDPYHGKLMSRNRRDSDDPQLKVYNGEDATAGEFPFMGLILSITGFDEQYYYQSMCGGSILSSRVVLTAAHCVLNDVLTTDDGTVVDSIYHPRNMQVVVGETDTGSQESTEQYMSVQGVIVHEDYNPTTIENDIAMIILNTDIALDSTIATIALPDDADFDTLYAAGAAITVIGWGTTESGSTSSDLQKLSYVVTSETDCDGTYGTQVKDGMMCTGESPMSEHSGTGDSGGPLFTKVDDVWTQLGLVSWGPTDESMTTTTWDVNTDVSYFKTWITSNKNIALTDYVASLTATDDSQAVIYADLRNYLYKSILISPTGSTKYTQITVKFGTMNEYDFLMIYDGNSVVTNTMLAQLTGTLSEQTYTATSTDGLTVVIMTSQDDESDGFVLEYSQVDAVGDSDDLYCSSGYTACTDKFYCVNNDLFCDNNGDCVDASDEVTENCNNTEDDDSTDDDNSTDDDTDCTDDSYSNCSEDWCEYDWIVQSYCQNTCGKCDDDDTSTDDDNTDDTTDDTTDEEVLCDFCVDLIYEDETYYYDNFPQCSNPTSVTCESSQVCGSVTLTFNETYTDNGSNVTYLYTTIAQSCIDTDETCQSVMSDFVEYEEDYFDGAYLKIDFFSCDLDHCDENGENCVDAVSWENGSPALRLASALIGVVLMMFFIL